jgi:hypothetical protein
MTTAHQQFSARTRQSGELDKPGSRRRNLGTGRLSVVFGADPACVLEDLASLDQRSVGGYVRKVVLEHLAAMGLVGDALAARAAELRAAKGAENEGEALPDPATPAAV